MANHKRFLTTILSGVALGMVGVGTHVFSSMGTSPSPAPEHFIKPIATSSKPEPILKSNIPSLYQNVARQKLFAIPLHKSQQVALNDDDTLDASWVVMDKVIVIPKFRG